MAQFYVNFIFKAVFYISAIIAHAAKISFQTMTKMYIFQVYLNSQMDKIGGSSFLLFFGFLYSMGLLG